MRDTIPVRSDETFDREKLAAYLAAHADLPGVDDPTQFSVRQFGGGMANLTYQLDFGAEQYVLRRPPLGPVAKSAHDMEREYTVLSVLHRAFSPAPRAFVYCDDAAVIGSPFFVMERRHGRVVRTKIPDAYADDPAAPRKMSMALVNTLADLHAVDYEALGLGDLGKPDGFITRQIEGWYKRWHKAKHEDVPQMGTVYEWLLAHQPQNTAATLVHNDYKLDNAMLHPDDPGRVTAVFDWDMCTLGDPLSDLGALLTYWTDPDDPPHMRMLAASFMPVGDHDFLTRRELITAYAERSGRDVSDIHFYHTLGLFRLTVIIAQIYIRYVRGQTQDQRFAALGQMIPMLVQAAHETSQSKE